METDLDFWGVEHVTINGDAQLIDPSGYKNAKWKIRHDKKSAFPIGSHTKLFASVALFQLDEMGLIDIDKSISDYLDVNDLVALGYNFENNQKLGIDNDTYCPMIINTNITECEEIKFIDLLTSNTGIMNMLNCQSWEYCWHTLGSCDGLPFEPYLGNVTFYIESFINLPLKYKPGIYDYNTTTHDYSNPNYLLVQYFIEKYSALSFGAYIEKYIAKPLGLKNTYFDPFDGSLGVHKNRVDEYVRIPDGKYKKYTVGKCIGWNQGFLGAMGGMVSTNKDMHKWWYYLFSRDNDKSLIFTKNDTIQRIIYPYVVYTAQPNYFGAGVLVKYDVDEDWPIALGFTGNAQCGFTTMQAIFSDDYQRMIIMSVFSNGRLFDYESIGVEQDNAQLLLNNEPYGFCWIKLMTGHSALNAHLETVNGLLNEWLNSTQFVDGN